MQQRASQQSLDQDVFKRKDQYCPLPLDHPLYVESADKQASRALAIGARAGDLVLWDSALVHANYAPTAKTVTGRLRRLVAYCAMAPFPQVSCVVLLSFSDCL